MIAGLGELALVMASVGVYGLIKYHVDQRTREIGIRMALGAVGGRVMRLVTVRALVLIVIGLTIGLGGAMALTRVLASELYEVSPTDPLTFTLVTIGVAIVALAACLIPTRRAMRVEPVKALRAE